MLAKGSVEETLRLPKVLSKAGSVSLIPTLDSRRGEKVRVESARLTGVDSGDGCMVSLALGVVGEIALR